MMRKFSGMHLQRILFCKVAMLGLMSLAIVSCGKTSPITASAFNTTFPGVPVAGGGGIGGDGGTPGETTVYEFLDEIPEGLRTFQSGVANSSSAPVRYRMLFVVTAGPGGFVREDDAILEYVSAGYRDLVQPGSAIGTTATIGCVPIRLTRGTRLLGFAAGQFFGPDVFLPANNSGDEDQFTGPMVTQRNDNGAPNIPLPELIYFTTDDPEFPCENPLQPCTQEAFQYFDAEMNQEIGKSVTGSRIQGTICNVGIGQSPEVRLDRTVDGQVAAFQFTPGSTIIWRVLNRQFDAPTNSRNQVVWTVVNADGDIVHGELP